MRLRLPHVALVGVLAFTVTGAATASIPNSQNGVYTGCYSKTNGALRVIDWEANGITCTSNETAMGWHAAGPKGATGSQGPAGPAGPKGATGPQGPAGISFARGHFRTTSKNVGTSWTNVASVDLPKGMHTVMGKTSPYIYETAYIETWAHVTCRLLQRSAAGAEKVLDMSDAEVGDDYNESAVVTTMGFAYVPEGTDKLHLQCKDDGGIGGDDTWLEQIKLAAQQVGGYTVLTN